MIDMQILIHAKNIGLAKQAALFFLGETFIVEVAIRKIIVRLHNFTSSTPLHAR